MICAQYPIENIMKVQKDLKVFDELKFEVIKACPNNTHPDFQEGYKNYAIFFFEEVTIHSDIFYDLAEGTCIIDLDFLKVDVRQMSMEFMSNRLPINKSEFMKGIDLSEEIAIQAFLFALVINPQARVA